MAERSEVVGADTPPHVVIYPGRGRLAELVVCYFMVTCRAPFRDQLYPEWGNVRFMIEGDWSVDARGAAATAVGGGELFGPTDRWTPVRAAPGAAVRGRAAGMMLTPIGWERLVRRPAYLMANRAEPLGDLLGVPGIAVTAALRALPGGKEDDGRWQAGAATLFDDLLLRRLASAPPPDPRSERLAAALAARPADAVAFAEMAELAPTVLRAACKRLFGFGPKRLLRRARLLDAVHRMRDAPDARPAAMRGAAFVDQPHFNHEFRDFMGTSPGAYRATPRPLIDAVDGAWPDQLPVSSIP